MTTIPVTVRLDEIERRLDRLERQIAALERLPAELQQIERVVGSLKYEVEEMQEA
ncbi:MAG TPA: hypothetical protein VF978_07510 [Gemmatimonadales bacterium]